ncbi:MAG: RHS repeat protein [Oscillospiraceae bacterium]|nr:RHS repeat protein [Oscillospiraceae bacterium]
MSDGSNLAVTYAYPVHYLDETGTYREIDNSLALYNEDGTPSHEAADAGLDAYLAAKKDRNAPEGPVDRRSYKNRNGQTEISLALLSDAERLASITCGEHTVSLTPLDPQTQSRFTAQGEEIELPVAGRLEKVKDTTVLSSLETAILPKNTASVVTYDGLFGNADLAYTTDSCALKEDIIINERADAYVYRFRLFPGALTPVMLESGRIELRDSAGDCVFFLPAGTMFDAAGESSGAVQYKLDDNGDGTYALSVVADEEWINAPERRFPVTIDPPVEISGFFNIETGSIFQWLPGETGGQRTAECIGWFNGSYARVLVRVNNLPSLPDNSYIVQSSICLYAFSYSYVGMSAMNISAHALMDNEPTTQGSEEYWCLYHTWNDCPERSGTVTDFVTVDISDQFRGFDVTREAIKWYKDPSVNYGLCLQASAEGSMTYSNCANTNFSSSNLENGDARPFFVVQYRNNIGLEDYYSYQPHDIDRAGTGYIGDYSGQLTLVKTDVEAASTVNPVVISHVYNSAYSGGGYEVIPGSGGLYANSGLGPGWKLNLQQSVTAADGGLAYIDGDGTVHYFNASGSVYKDEDGLGLTISGSGGSYTMTDRKGNACQFVGGMLKSMTDTNGNTITINFSGSRITGVTRQNDGGAAETIASLSYSQEGYLSGITDAAGRTTSFSYNDGRLSQVTHPDGTSVCYGYTGGKLSSATDLESGYSVHYEYGAGGRITKFYEKAGSTVGAEVSVSGGDGIQIYRSNGKDRVLNTGDDLISSYVFDYCGRTITSSLTNADGTVTYGAAAAKYKINSGVALTNNRLTVSGEVGMRPVGSTAGYTFLNENLLGGSDASSTTGWTGGTRQTDPRFGYALKVTGAIGETREVSKTVTIPASDRLNKSYTLSAWAKADSVALSAGNRSFMLRATLIYTDNQTEVSQLSFCPDSLEWQYASLPLVPKRSVGVAQIKVSFLFNHNPNTALFTNACLTADSAQSYTYDDEGNLTSVSEPGSAAAGFTYSGADLMTQVTRGNGTYEYDYDSAHNLTEVSNNGVTMSLSYDAKGNTTGSTLTGNTLTIGSSAEYTYNGNLLSRQTDSRGGQTSYAYGSAISRQLGRPTAVTDPKGVSVSTGYNASNGRVTGSSMTGVSLAFGYANGRLSSLSRTAGGSTQSYSLSYSGFGSLTSVKVGTRTLVTNGYSSHNGLRSATFLGSSSFAYDYDELERLRHVYYNNGSSPALSYSYYGEGPLQSLTDSVNNRSYVYSYDTLNRLTGLEEKVGTNTVQSWTAVYDTASRPQSLSYTVSPQWNGTFTGTRSYSFTYRSSDGALTAMGTPGGTLRFGYDWLQRRTSQTLSVAGTDKLKRQYLYLPGSGGNTTTLVKNVLFKKADDTLLRAYTYSYDANGNITGVTGSRTASYTYDSQNRLTWASEGTLSSQTETSYTYDGAGNLLTKSSGGVTDTYTYGDSGWKDLLTAYNGHAITYDGIGNPLSYHDGTVFTWVNGRRLATAVNTGSGLNVSYTYDADGLRLSKTVGGVVHKYVWQDGRLISEQFGNNTLEFFYDDVGRPFSVKVNGGTYFYITNLQGDVTAICNASGSILAVYNYDAYGKITSMTDNSLTRVNPLRYRGYYYDSETGFYYLKGRYYDPNICRFINADDPSALGANSDFASVNLFAYCGDNPVNRKDDGGEFWEAVAVGFFVGLVGQYASDVIENISNGKTGFDILSPTSSARDYLASGVGGAIAAIPGLGVVGTMAVGAAGNVVADCIRGNNGLKDLGQSAARGAFANLLGYGAAKAVAAMKVGQIGNMPRNAQKIFLRDELFHNSQSFANQNLRTFANNTLLENITLVETNLATLRSGIYSTITSSFALLFK